MVNATQRGSAMVVRISSARQQGTRAISLVRGRRLCDRSGRICIGQGILATPGLRGINEFWSVSFGLEVAIFELVAGACERQSPMISSSCSLPITRSSRGEGGLGLVCRGELEVRSRKPERWRDGRWQVKCRTHGSNLTAHNFDPFSLERKKYSRSSFGFASCVYAS